MRQDFILNGQGYGPVGSALVENNCDVGLFRPFIETDYNSPRYMQRCVVVNTGRTWDEKGGKFIPKYEKLTVHEARANGIDVPLSNLVGNATTLSKEEWITFDNTVITVQRKRLILFGDIAANSMMRVDGMSTDIIENETITDPGQINVDMEGIGDGIADLPIRQLYGVPLAVTWGSFWFSRRYLNIARKNGRSPSTHMAEAITRRCAEEVEKTAIGVVTGITFGGTTGWTPAYGRASTSYGLTNFPPRLIYSTLVAPTGSNGPAVHASILLMRDAMYAQNFFGPYVLYVSNDWDAYLDLPFDSGNASNITLRQMILSNPSFIRIQRLDYLDGDFRVLMVQLEKNVVEAINGADFTMQQWESHGGDKLNFKVWGIQAIRCNADALGQCGIGDGSPP